ncbi:hypothetical protein [Thermostaphylospora chromogena]|nr:hypothetical protein [Thermostaphylospora chromogena]
MTVRKQRGMSRAELKQSAAMTVAVLLVLGLLAAWSVLIPGVDAWENIVVAVIGSLRLTGPVAAAFACWVALRKRRACAGRALTTWQAVKVPLAITVVTGGSFAATALLMAIKSVMVEQAGRLPPSALAMGLAGLTLYVTIGWVSGWLLPWAIMPLVSAIGCYVLFTWLAEGSTWADRLAPTTPEPYHVFQALSAAEFTDQTLWLVGVSAALLLGWAAIVTRQALVLAAAMLAILAAATGMARLVSHPRPVSAEPVVYTCQEWPITICVHPGMRGGLPELGATFTKLASRLAGTPGEFVRVEQHPRGEAVELPPGVVPVHLDDLATGFAEEAAAEFLERLAMECDGTPPEGYRQIVMAWLRGEPLPAGPLAEHQYAAAWFSGLTEAQRRDWLRMFYTDFARCTLRAEHFGGGPRMWADDRHDTRSGSAAGARRARPVPARPQPGPTPRPSVPEPAPAPMPTEPPSPSPDVSGSGPDRPKGAASKEADRREEDPRRLARSDRWRDIPGGRSWFDRWWRDHVPGDLDRHAAHAPGRSG